MKQQQSHTVDNASDRKTLNPLCCQDKRDATVQSWCLVSLNYKSKPNFHHLHGNLFYCYQRLVLANQDYLCISHQLLRLLCCILMFFEKLKNIKKSKCRKICIYYVLLTVL